MPAHDSQLQHESRARQLDRTSDGTMHSRAQRHVQALERTALSKAEGERGAEHRLRITTLMETPSLTLGSRSVLGEQVDVRVGPVGPWLVRQSWRDTFFVHWQVDPDELRTILPGALEVDTFDDSAWASLVAFQVVGMRLRGCPPLPFLSSFAQLNVRTYVSHQGRPGVYFFALDANHPVVVYGGRALFHQPYHFAHIKVRQGDEGTRIDHQRLFSEDASSAALTCEPFGTPFIPHKGSLEHWLSERYHLFVSQDGRLWTASIQHDPWLLRHANASVELNTLTSSCGIELPNHPPFAFHSASQDAVMHRATRIS